MAVIKCSNCENEILDTEIVCPYCDCPVSTTKKHIEDMKNASSLDGETIVTSKAEIEKEIENYTAESEGQYNDDENEEIQSETGADENKPEPVSEPVPESENQKVSDITMKISGDDIQSDTLRRSLEERKAQREKKGGKKDKKIIILVTTIIGIFLVIYLLVSVFSKIMGEGLFEDEKPNKKANKDVSSSAQMKELGFDFRSHTLTIIDEEIVMTDYQPKAVKPWKDYKKDVTNLTIADGIETIAAHAFDDLSSLRHVTLAPSVKTLGDSAFYACTKLEKLVFDTEKSELKSVGNYTFTDCSSLKSVTFPETLIRIGEGAFKSCKSLEKVVIPDSCEEIGADAFLGCHNVVIVCSKDSQAYQYAKENGITVELTDSEDETNVSNEEPSEKPTSKPAKPTEEKPASKPDPEPQPKPEHKPEPEPEPEKGKTTEEKIADLMNKLSNAKTQEESDAILAEIDKLMQ